MRVGIDVGGTNTDAVLMDGDRVLAAVKRGTTADVTAGIVAALQGVLDEAGATPAGVEAVMIGTTHFTNAVVEARRLLEVGVVRLGLPATAALPPMVAWPQRLADAVGAHVFMCHGGHEFDGRPIAPLDPDELRRAGERIHALGLRTVAISSVFSPISEELEHEAAELIREVAGDVAVSCSSEIGRLGLLERENATIINASLAELATHITQAFGAALVEAGVEAPVYLSQNDGTLMTVDYVERYPVATFASGPTNSMRGAALLSGETDCAVVDVGGTTSDVGMLVHSFPREAKATVEVGGVRTNFRMPDVLPLGIGGGSVVEPGGIEVGPHSVGYELTSRALVFGGDTLTATDLAVAAGLAEIGDAAAVRDLDPARVRRALERIAERIGQAVDRMKVVSGDVPVVAVGGGSILLGDALSGVSRLVRPDNYAVANAVGAAIAQVGGEVDQMFSIGSGLTREEALEQASEEATARALAAGARPGSVRVVDVEELAIAYVPGNAVRIKVKAVGDLELRGASVAADR
ncbi:hydantoinase/oxoprolinase N-terminal domain-containing protein [Conexibacter woesei]|uniref:Hydantoinase/oxoprolinase n=1 Tax=Conexibacter woesei (strain DSM 14684 / CCUG 47730 / CIP 108061 / JCM 11494 / NBRC 100937 / ID131577) TaxID=469383 RepID=D3F4R8_CONWI|nr:hydantoinase/oxoprolinase family protein [Conexibacter woesei]ADB52525.1 Hydantoinase/oxoprolinase [Conexibacter woesei DSM 14684]